MSEIERIKTQVELIDNGMMHTHFSVKSIKILLAALAESEAKRMEAEKERKYTLKVLDETLAESGNDCTKLINLQNQLTTLRTQITALTTERDELRGRLEEAISIADYFAGIVEPPDPHNENEPCEQCKMHRRLEAIKQAGESPTK